MNNVLNLIPSLRKKCKHGSFVIDTSLYTVECGICGEKLNPMFVLEQYAKGESRLNDRVDYLKKLEKETSEKVKCKCQHCGKMTKIYNARDEQKANNL